MAMASGGGEGTIQLAAARARVSCRRSSSSSIEVTSPARSGEDAVREEGHHCPWCEEYRRLRVGASDPPLPGSKAGGSHGSTGSGHSMAPSATELVTASGESEKSPSVEPKSSPTRRGSIGSSSRHGDSEDSSSQPRLVLSSASFVPDGTEDSSWGGVDGDALFQCSHGKPARWLFCWQGKHTGHRFFVCHLEDKSQRCRFVQWLDGPWHPQAQAMMSRLWRMIRHYNNIADKNQVDYMAQYAMTSETLEEMQSLMQEKEAWEREKQSLVMERDQLRRETEDVHMRWRFAHGLCQAMQVNVRNEVCEKKRIWMVVICLVGCLVAFIFGVVVKLK